MIANDYTLPLIPQNNITYNKYCIQVLIILLPDVLDPVVQSLPNTQPSKQTPEPDY
jgi:hypothetical protein